MAKVVMPLLSAEASGKIADTMVYFYWKGLNVVRRWVVPTNPRDPDQKRVRTKLAAMGKNLAAMTTAAPAGAIVPLIKAETPPNMIWNAHFCKQTLNHIKTAANYTALLSSYCNVATLTTEFGPMASALLMTPIVSNAQFDEDVSAGFQLFLGAYAAYKLGLSSTRANYSTHPTNWLSDTITNFAKDYTSA